MFTSILENNYLIKDSMKNLKINTIKNTFLLAVILLVNVSCERNLSDDATPSTFSKNADVFIDTFSAGLGYGAFGGSNYTAFTVDTEVKYQGSASMRFDVPSVGDPNGAYAGGVFIDGSGRDLTEYDALTFWVKGSQAATINEVGFGTDFGLNKYNVRMQNVPIDTNWKKIIIPIPNASKLVQEKGLFWYSEGAENNLGYTFWIDNVKYEKLGTIAHPQPKIMDGLDATQQTYIGASINLTGLSETFNMPNGTNQTISLAPSYYTFTSSNPSVATVSESGVVTVLTGGTTVISATLAGTPAVGSLIINSLGTFTAAPTPTVNPANVISIFSNAYTNVPVEYYNGYWAPWQTTLGQDDIHINGDDLIKYSQFNFVGIQFSQPTINASQMTYVHVDLKVLNTTGARNSIKIKLVDFGADGVYGGLIDSSHEYTFNSSSLPTGNWVSVELPLSAFTGLTSKAHMGQFILGPSTAGITDLLVDNVYFHN
jgi:hypothetical protein